ncbi:MAG: VacJ family lipoprotein [Alteraurantiacibacter sp.]
MATEQVALQAQAPTEVTIPADAPVVVVPEVAAAPDAAGAPPPEPVTDGDVIIVEGQIGPPPGDPAEQINQAVYGVAQDVDQAVVGPIAEVYQDDIPKDLRNGLRNFLRNLMEPVNALNFLLQLKPGKALETLGRFAINSTVGIAGLVDIARRDPFNLPWRRNGLSNTLGYYGVGPGPYFYLPLIGATTLRDLAGSLVDQAVVPFIVGPPLNTPYYGVPAYAISSLQYRIDFDETLGQIRESIDPYEAARERYLCMREADIEALHNRPPPRDCRIDALMGELDDEPAAVPAPAAEAPPEAEQQAVLDVVPELPVLPVEPSDAVTVDIAA